MLPILHPGPLWDIVEEHLDEAEFLWELWQHALVSPKYTLAEVEAGPKARLDAHIDALVAHGPEVADALLLPALASEDAAPARVSAAATALLLSPGEAGITAVLAALQTHIVQRPALARALEYCERREIPPRLRPFLHATDLDLRDTAAKILVFRRAPLGEALTTLLTSDRATARIVGLQALLYEPATARHQRAVLQALGAPEPQVRDAAWTAAAVLRLPQVWSELRARALEPGCDHALLLLALRGDPADHALLIAGLAHPGRRAAALWALGFLGTPAAVTASLAHLEEAGVSRLAGEVFSAVTGLDLEIEHMARDLDEDPDADEGRFDPERELPVPDSLKLLQWWLRNSAAYSTPGRRWIDGAPLGGGQLQRSLASCRARRRAALELAALLIPDVD